MKDNTENLEETNEVSETDNEFFEIRNLIKNSKNLEPEIVDMVNRNFWELLLKI